MTSNRIKQLLAGNDLRSIGKSNEIAKTVNTQKDFDELIDCLYNKNRVIVMRAADAIEKITKNKVAFLQKHKKKLLDMCISASDKELKWHISLLVARLQLTRAELGFAWYYFKEWALNKNNSRIVRVNAIQSLYELTIQNIDLLSDFYNVLTKVENENIPSIKARVKKLTKKNPLLK